MPNYNQGKIYKLVAPSGLTYVGSTCEKLSVRKAKHKAKFSAYKRGTYHFITAFKLFDESIDEIDVVLLENVPCKSKEELHQRERYHIENNICVNKLIPSRPAKEYKDQWYKDNKEKIKERHPRTACVCGSMVSSNRKATHELSKKHIAFVN